MERKNIKMVVTDLDNTILSADKQINEKTTEEFKNIKSKGILLVVATARSIKMAGKYTDKLQPDFILSSDGAIIGEKDRIIASKLLSVEQTNRIMQMLNGDSIKRISVVTRNDEYNNFGGKMYPNYFNEGAAKIICEVTTEKKAEELLLNSRDCAVSRYTGELWIRFANKRVSKKNALRILADFNHISMENIMCFGDDWNDREMIEECGIGVAVSNAIDSVKEIADVVVENSNNDGVANYLKKYFGE